AEAAGRAASRRPAALPADAGHRGRQQRLAERHPLASPAPSPHPHGRAGTHRAGMVARSRGKPARLLLRGRHRRPALLAVPQPQHLVPARAVRMTAYAELQVTSNFSFLEGASHAHELVGQAAALGLSAIAITDRNSLAGVVRALSAIRQQGLEKKLQLIIGARIDLRDGPSVLLLPEDRAAYGRLSRLISKGRRAAPKGECELYWSDLLEELDGQQAILLPP